MEVLESSSHFRLLFDTFLSPQNSDNITNPSPLVDTFLSPQTGNKQLNENPNSNSSSVIVHEQADSNKRGEPKQKKNSKKKQKGNQTWYKGPWTKTEDRKLNRLVCHLGRGNWSKVASQMPGRIGKQCRERWHNNLRPNIWKRTSWSDEEEMTIIEGHKIFGNRWSAIAKFLRGRSENDVKNHWHSIKRKQKTLRKIKRAKRLRHLYQSPILQNYIKNTTNFLTTTSSSRSAAIAAALPPAFTLTTTTSPPIAAAPFTLTTTTTTAENNALVAIYSTPTPITAATFTPPPFTIFTENYNALSTSAATFTPPPICTIAENYETLIPTFSTLTPPPAMTTESNAALIATEVPLCVDENSEVQPDNLASESDIDENDLDLIHYDDDVIGIRSFPMIGDAYYAASAAYLATETVNEEMEFMTSLFGNIN